MKYFPRNTLAYYLASPQAQRQDLSGLPTSVFSAATCAYMDGGKGYAKPDHQAFLFYAANHCAALVKARYTPNEPLPEWAQQVMAQYDHIRNELGFRLLHYVLQICTREMRHLPDEPDTDAMKTCRKKYGKTMSAFLTEIKSYPNEDEAMAQYRNAPPKASIGRYVNALSYMFHEGGWTEGGAFGGSHWGVVADAAKEYLHGRTSMEVFLDTGYTLAHNGGPIFNKGMLYHRQNNEYLWTVLDVQASGQIPELALDPQADTFLTMIPPGVQQIVDITAKALPGEFRGWVDWHTVVATHDRNYAGFKMSQDIKHPKPKVPAKPVVTVPVVPVLKMVGGKMVEIVGDWAVAPDQTAKVYKRVS